MDEQKGDRSRISRDAVQTYKEGFVFIYCRLNFVITIWSKRGIRLTPTRAPIPKPLRQCSNAATYSNGILEIMQLTHVHDLHDLADRLMGMSSKSYSKYHE